jgi:flagellar FliL protein
MADPTPDPTPDETAAPAKKRRLPLIIALAVVVLGAAGGAAWWFLGRGGAEQGADGAAAAAPLAEPIYVALDPPFVVNFEAGGQVRFLQVAAQAMTRDPAVAELLKRHDPMVRNSLLLLLAGQSYESIATREGKEALRHRALEEVRAVAKAQGGDGAKVEDLYFTSFVMQ